MKKSGVDTTLILHLLVEGLTQKYDDINKLLDTNLAQVVGEIKSLMPKEFSEKKDWENINRFIEALSEVLSKGSSFGMISSTDLGDGIYKLVIDNCGHSLNIHKRKVLSPICPKLLFSLLLIKDQFPDKDIKIDYTAYSKRGGSAEVKIG